MNSFAARFSTDAPPRLSRPSRGLVRPGQRRAAGSSLEDETKVHPGGSGVANSYRVCTTSAASKRCPIGTNRLCFSSFLRTVANGSWFRSRASTSIRSNLVAVLRFTQARLTETGFEHDREWLVITPEGRFLTQRERPQLAQIETALTDDQLVLAQAGRRRPERSPGTRAAASWKSRSGATRWRPSMRAMRPRPGSPSTWASPRDWCASISVASVRATLSGPVAPRRRLNFADGYPWLLISQGSLDELNRRMRDAAADESLPSQHRGRRPAAVRRGQRR